MSNPTVERESIAKVRYFRFKGGPKNQPLRYCVSCSLTLKDGRVITGQGPWTDSEGTNRRADNKIARAAAERQLNAAAKPD